MTIWCISARYSCVMGGCRLWSGTRTSSLGSNIVSVLIKVATYIRRPFSAGVQTLCSVNVERTKALKLAGVKHLSIS